MNHFYHFTRVSMNKKTGPIPTTTSSVSTCPNSCNLKGNGCYADYGPLALHWRQVSSGARGGTLDELCAKIKRLPKRQLWRYAQAGDLPGDGKLIDFAAVAQLVEANAGRCGFGYTHYDPRLPMNEAALRHANKHGLIISLSAETLEQADEYAELDIAPVACVLPADTTKPLRTPGGRLVTVCPASVRDDIDCASCGICAAPGHKAVIGFPAHGSGAKKAQVVFFARNASRVTIGPKLALALETV